MYSFLKKGRGLNEETLARKFVDVFNKIRRTAYFPTVKIFNYEIVHFLCQVE